MKIAIYHPWIYVKSGLERTIMEIKKRSRHDWTIFTSHYDREATYPGLKAMGVREINPVGVERSYKTVIKAGLSMVSTKIAMDDFDALVICCDGLGSLLSFRNAEKPVICLCFTPLRAVYDEEYRARFLKRLGRLRPFALLAEILYKAVDRLAWQRYAHVFCISKAVQERVASGGLYPADKIEIAYPGLDEALIDRPHLAGDYFLIPGRIMWTKNIELGIEAFLEFRKRSGAPLRLVIAGMVDRKSQPYYAMLQGLARPDAAISFVIGPTDQEMRRLYEGCLAMLFTPFNEDFGLTPLEAMACGKPVIAVDRGGPREVVLHQETGLRVEGEPMKFAEAMEWLYTNPTQAAAMGTLGFQRARLFTWSAFVEKIDSYLDSTRGGNRDTA